MHKSGASKAAIDEVNASRSVPILVRQVEYPNNIRKGVANSQLNDAPSQEDPHYRHRLHVYTFIMYILV